MLSLVGAVVVAGVCWMSGKEGWAMFVIALYLAQAVLFSML
ncbi:MAG: hypothetical protein ACI8PZ_006007 [Myxococcota bacterium]|jgi:hypothetical protein